MIVSNESIRRYNLRTTTGNVLYLLNDSNVTSVYYLLAHPTGQLSNFANMPVKFNFDNHDGIPFILLVMVDWMDLFTRKEFALDPGYTQLRQRMKCLNIHAYCVIRNYV